MTQHPLDSNRDSYNIPRAYDARHDSGRCGDPCLDGTRVDLLREIYSWIDQSESERNGANLNASSSSKIPKSGADPRRIFWLSRLAGSGKSAVSQSVCHWGSKRNCLGASFFFRRGDGVRGNGELFFSTVAHQLATFHPPLRLLVNEVITADPDIFHTALDNQLIKLIVEPLRTLGDTFPSPTIVVIDALDECNDEDILLILSALSSHVNDLPLQIFITSRPDAAIRKALLSSDFQLGDVMHQYLLHKTPAKTAEADIFHFLRHRLSQLESKYPELLGTSWITEGDIQTIAARSEGLFLFAATAVHYIEDPRYEDPKAQLESLIAGYRDSVSSDSPRHRHLDQLFAQVLGEALPASSSRSKITRYNIVVGSITLLSAQVSATGLASLLRMKPGVVMNALQHLHSVIIVPEGDEAIRTANRAFTESVTHKSCPKLLRIETPNAHRFLALRCFDQLKMLRRNMCKLTDRLRLNQDIADLRKLALAKIPLPLQYACRYWAKHFSHAALSESILDYLDIFCSECSIYWLQVLSLMGDLHIATTLLQTAMSAVIVRFLDRSL
jgi:hypothetical protein